MLKKVGKGKEKEWLSAFILFFFLQLLPSILTVCLGHYTGFSPGRQNLALPFVCHPMSNLGRGGAVRGGKWSHSALLNQGKVKNVDCANQELICSTGPLCLISNMKSY